MIVRSLTALTVALAATAAAPAGDKGGKVAWKTDPQKAMSEAQKLGAGMMLYFTSEGCPPCAALERGAFSDDSVVKAAESVVAILVDCDWGKKNQDVSKRYGIRSYPTVLFTDPKGELVARMNQRTPSALRKQIEELAKKHRMKKGDADTLEPVELPYGRDLAQALADGKQDGKPVVVVFGDGEEDAIGTGHALLEKEVAEALEPFVTVQIPIQKDCPICAQYKVRRGSMIKVLDPTAEDPSARPLASLRGKRNAKSLRLSLTRALDKWKKDQGQTP